MIESINFTAALPVVAYQSNALDRDKVKITVMFAMLIITENKSF